MLWELLTGEQSILSTSGKPAEVGKALQFAKNLFRSLVPAVFQIWSPHRGLMKFLLLFSCDLFCTSEGGKWSLLGFFVVVSSDSVLSLSSSISAHTF